LKVERIGFVGLGVMGTPMAQHLAAAGHALTVHDLNLDASTALRARHSNVKVALTPKEVAEGSEIIITMLPSGREVSDTVFGPNGLLQGFK
jgi:3-hydroxyisobutyrate dehydrogenase-like beta-hydroxyacid dehydrogenase